MRAQQIKLQTLWPEWPVIITHTVHSRTAQTAHVISIKMQTQLRRLSCHNLQNICRSLAVAFLISFDSVRWPWPSSYLYTCNSVCRQARWLTVVIAQLSKRVEVRQVNCVLTARGAGELVMNSPDPGVGRLLGVSLAAHSNTPPSTCARLRTCTQKKILKCLQSSLSYLT
jgi:hypothetical protein